MPVMYTTGMRTWLEQSHAHMFVDAHTHNKIKHAVTYTETCADRMHVLTHIGGWGGTS